MAKISKIKLPNESPRDLVDAGAVRFDGTQTLNDKQKKLAKNNIGMTGVLTIGDHTFDGTENVAVPTYNGEYEFGNLEEMPTDYESFKRMIIGWGLVVVDGKLCIRYGSEE